MSKLINFFLIAVVIGGCANAKKSTPQQLTRGLPGTTLYLRTDLRGMTKEELIKLMRSEPISSEFENSDEEVLKFKVFRHPKFTTKGFDMLTVRLRNGKVVSYSDYDIETVYEDLSEVTNEEFK